MKVLISGGSGLLGRKISKVLSESGHEVAWLGRKAPMELPPGIRFFSWDPEKGSMDSEAVLFPEALINLAGASIGETSWNSRGKKEILESRIGSVRTLTAFFSERMPLTSFVGISGAGYYGKGSRPFPETDPAGSDFPAQVAFAWEKAYQEFQKKCKPENHAVLRLAVVLSAEGGALPKILQPFRLGLGSPLGQGRQGFCWIHETDAARAIAAALNWNGVFNVSAPAQDDNQKLSKLIAKTLKKPMFLPAVPGIMLKILLGERSSLVLEGNFLDVTKIKAQGFHFAFPELEKALTDLLAKQP